ncbi:MAG: diaminopimelate decarboxylase, partial [Spirochaetaceae bacterium]
MKDIALPFNRQQLEAIIQDHPTPFHIYDEKAIRENARALYKAFAWVPGGYKNYFAVKATPNPRLMQILQEEGMGFDCSSKPELLLCERIGVEGEQIMFTSNDTPWDEYQAAIRMGAVVNLDDISHIDYLLDNGGELPKLISFRYNPGPLKAGNAIIGHPEEAKYGLTRDQLFEAYAKAAKNGSERFGLHTMVASNELNGDYFIETARMLFDLVVEIKQKMDIQIEFVNLGGGIGIPYKLTDAPVDFQYVSDGVKREYEATIVAAGLPDVRICMENGRCITGPYGYLVSR